MSTLQQQPLQKAVHSELEIALKKRRSRENSVETDLPTRCHIEVNSNSNNNINNNLETSSTQRCNCCPYGYHIDLDFLRYCEEISSGATLKKLKRNSRPRKKAVKLFSKPSPPIVPPKPPKDKRRRAKSADGSIEPELILKQENQLFSAAFSDFADLIHKRYIPGNHRSQFIHKASSDTRSLPANPTDASYSDFENESTLSLDGLDINHSNDELFIEEVEQKLMLGNSPTHIKHHLPSDLSPLTNLVSCKSDSLSSLDSQSTTASSLPSIPPVTSGNDQLVSNMAYSISKLAHVKQVDSGSHSGRSTPSSSITPNTLAAIRQQMAVALQRLRELEEQAKLIPVLTVKLSVLKEEKRLMMLQLKSKKQSPNTTDVGVGDCTIDYIEHTEKRSSNITTIQMSSKFTRSPSQTKLVENKVEMKSIGIMAKMLPDLCNHGERSNGIQPIEETIISKVSDTELVHSAPPNVLVQKPEMRDSSVNTDIINTCAVGINVSAQTIASSTNTQQVEMSEKSSFIELSTNDQQCSTVNPVMAISSTNTELQVANQSTSTEYFKKNLPSCGVNTDILTTSIIGTNTDSLNIEKPDVIDSTCNTEPVVVKEYVTKKDSFTDMIKTTKDCGIVTESLSVQDQQTEVILDSHDVATETIMNSMNQCTNTDSLQTIEKSTQFETELSDKGISATVGSHDLATGMELVQIEKATSCEALPEMINTGVGNGDVRAPTTSTDVSVKLTTDFNVDTFCCQCDNVFSNSVDGSDSGIAISPDARISEDVSSVETLEVHQIPLGYSITSNSDNEKESTINMPNQKMECYKPLDEIDNITQFPSFDDVWSKENEDLLEEQQDVSASLSYSPTQSQSSIAEDLHSGRSEYTVIPGISSTESPENNTDNPTSSMGIPSSSTASWYQHDNLFAGGFTNMHAIREDELTVQVDKPTMDNGSSQTNSSIQNKKDINDVTKLAPSSSSSDDESSESDSESSDGSSNASTSPDEGCYDSELGQITYHKVAHGKLTSLVDYSTEVKEVPKIRREMPTLKEVEVEEGFALNPAVYSSLDQMEALLTNGMEERIQDLLTSTSVIAREWFRITSQKTSDCNEVKTFLSALATKPKVLREKVVNMVDHNINTALHYSVSHCNYEIVEQLLDSGDCSVNKQNKAGYTATMLASLSEVTNELQRVCIRRLFNLGDVNIKDTRDGQTALMLAVSHGRVQTVELLLEAKADLNIQDEDGSDAFSIAMETGNKDIGVLLYAHLNFKSPTSNKLKKRSTSPQRHHYHASPERAVTASCSLTALDQLHNLASSSIKVTPPSKLPVSTSYRSRSQSPNSRKPLIKPLVTKTSEPKLKKRTTSAMRSPSSPSSQPKFTTRTSLLTSYINRAAFSSSSERTTRGPQNTRIIKESNKEAKNSNLQRFKTTKIIYQKTNGNNVN
ncbi:uncharacterized protein [Antedon mediterranea]|uniref:uncharacterized protein isoform X2 n=1 Tax=Antedon mediterranea TaxID=105859 RepID=UPI003AF6C2AF